MDDAKGVTGLLLVQTDLPDCAFSHILSVLAARGLPAA
jgi:hypothetical protein